MIGSILADIGAFLALGWGIAHLFPTQKVVSAFGGISDENKRIIKMEWIIEGVLLIFIGILVTVVTCLDSHSPISLAVYWMSFGVLNTLSIVSVFTGFKNSFIAFKLCPFIFSG